MARKKAEKKPANTGTTTANSNKPVRKKKETVNYDNKSMTVYENGTERNIPLNNKQIAELLYGNKFLLKGKNKKQKELLTEIGLKEITIAVGPAGTGKSHVSVAKSLELLANPDNSYQKIYIITPNVEIPGSELGFLKGSLEDKMFPYLFSTYYLIDKIIGKSNREKLVEMDIISIMPVGFLRGINFDNCVVFGEEMQNLSTLQFKTLITRIGYNCRYVLNGDLEQVDIKEKTNGLKDAISKFSDMDEIGIIKFEKEDIVRNPLISKILSKY